MDSRTVLFSLLIRQTPEIVETMRSREILSMEDEFWVIIEVCKSEKAVSPHHGRNGPGYFTVTS